MTITRKVKTANIFEVLDKFKGIGLFSVKSLKLGQKHEFGERAEQYIRMLTHHWFSLTWNATRALAFNLAENLKINHLFHREERILG